MNIQTSTIRVPKKVLESIKIYSQKHGRQVGEWGEYAWNFISKNDFDIYDDRYTPSLPVEEEKPNQIELIRSAMSEQLMPIIQQINPSRLLELGAEKGRTEGQVELLKEQNSKLEKENQVLNEKYNLALAELQRIEREQRTVGKLKIKTSF